MRSRRTRAAIVAMAALLVLPAAPVARAAVHKRAVIRGSDSSPEGASGTEKTASPSARRQRRHKRNRGPAREKRPVSSRSRGRGSSAPAQLVPARFWVTADPEDPLPGDIVHVTVRFVPGTGNGIGHHAAFHLGANPKLLHYLGFKPTGRGALIVRRSPRGDGTLVVYRSSLPEGFGPTEALVELEYQSLARGSDTIVLSDVHLLDRRASNLGFTAENGDVEIQ